MAIRTQIAFIGRFVRRRLGLGSYLPADVTASGNPTTLRVMNPDFFDPVGGTLFYVNQSGADKYFTYASINGDLLSGIPAAGDGEIDSDMYDFAESVNTPTLVYRGDVDDEELERAIDRQRIWVVEELIEESDDEGKRWKTAFGWFDTNVQIRTAEGSSYSTVTLGGSDTINYETGEVVFNTARTESRLWLAGFAYNPFYTIADLLTQHQNDSRFMSYLQVGQTARSQVLALDLAKYYRGLGSPMAFCR